MREVNPSEKDQSPLVRESVVSTNWLDVELFRNAEELCVCGRTAVEIYFSLTNDDWNVFVDLRNVNEIYSEVVSVETPPNASRIECEDNFHGD